MNRVLILANEHVNRRMAGPAIRCYEFAAELNRRGHAVTLASPFASDLPPQDFAVTQYDTESIEALARGHQVVVLQGFTLERHPILRECGARLVVDLYDPFPLEALILFEREPLAKRLQTHEHNLGAVNQQVRDGDFFLCASDKQFDFWAGWLCAMDRINPYTHADDPRLRSLLDVVPFGIPAVPPVRRAPAIRGVLPGVGPDDLVLLWGGGIYNWFDPVSLIRAVALAAATLPRIRLVFMSTGHPNPAIQQMWTQVEARRVADELGLTGRHVFFNESWISYEDRADWFLDADIGVSTHFDHIETRFSFRTRILDYFWCGLPVITTAGDTLAVAIEAGDLGRTVPAEDPVAIAAAIVALGSDAEQRRLCSERVRAHAKSLTWASAVEPLARYCADPRPAADRAAIDSQGRTPVPGAGHALPRASGWRGIAAGGRRVQSALEAVTARARSLHNRENGRS